MTLNLGCDERQTIEDSSVSLAPVGVMASNAASGVLPNVAIAETEAEEARTDDVQPVVVRGRPSEAELRELLDDHGAAMYRVAISIVRDPALAEDVVQDSTIRVWEALPTFRGDAPIRSWILRITHNSAVSMLRKIKDVAWPPDQMPDAVDSADVSRTVEARGDLVALGDALRGLDELSRSVIVLREVEGMTYDEIAVALEITLPTVKTRLLRARRSLQATLKEGGGS